VRKFRFFGLKGSWYILEEHSGVSISGAHGDDFGYWWVATTCKLKEVWLALYLARIDSYHQTLIDCKYDLHFRMATG
jgi:hypothetical protein